MSKIYYMGSFPPPYGGVTIKNELLYEQLKDKFDICRKQKFTTLSTIEALLKGRRFILGVGHTKFLLLLTTVMYYFRPKAMSRSIVFAMGGNLADLVEDNPVMIKRLQRYLCIYVEPTGMMNRLQKMGLKNLSLLPNCRVRPERNAVTYKDNGNLHCVFFSTIQENKGVDNILSVAKEMSNIAFTFYGHIDDDYKEVFTNAVAELSNVKYMGVFSGDSESVYSELAKYDVVLLPTKWKTEGIPGILVEAKIAGVTCIVSDECYNSEIIKNSEEGIVLSENTPERLKEAIVKLDSDRELLDRFKSTNHASAEKYYIENYIDKIEKSMRGGVTRRKLKAVFFSRVSPDKGIDIILDVARTLSTVEFHLYGEIDSDYHDVFTKELDQLANATYHGVFKGKDAEVYDELSKYDVMLLPTRWKFEGIPGVLVEAKIAGIPSIVSDICYNAEIVEDGISGIVLKENTAICLTEAIRHLDQNRSELAKLKFGAKKSAERYYIDNYLEDILKKLEESQ